MCSAADQYQLLLSPDARVTQTTCRNIGSPSLDLSVQWYDNTAF